MLNELQPEDAEIVEHIGLVEEALGRKEEAIQTMERAMALKTPDPAVAERIQKALERMQGKNPEPAKETETE